MRNLKLVMEYEGTNYHGFQRQINSKLTIQEILEEKLFVLTEEEIKITASGRTDAGVHAKGQVINFFTNSNIPVERFPLALNSMLPEDIAIKKAEEVPLEFHSRYSAKSKVYSYNILNSLTPSPFFRNFTYFLPRTLDLEKMRQGSTYLLGEHDFIAFRSAGSSVKRTIRHIYRLEIREKEEQLIELEVEANGFLYNMVRIIVGTLVQVGMGKMAPEAVKEILESRDRRKAGQTAPAKGLVLQEVKYFS